MIGIVTFLVGLLLAIGYQCLVCRDKEEQNERERKLRKEYVPPMQRDIEEPNIELILKDYETMNREIHNRAIITQGIGAILIGASFLILGNVAMGKCLSQNSKYSMSIVSLGLYVLWLFVFHRTAKKLDDMTYGRIRVIEGVLSKEEEKNKKCDFGIHRYIYSEAEKSRWISFRRGFWTEVLILLFIGWALVLSLPSGY